MWCQIISSSSQTPQMAILPSDNYCLMTIFLPCHKVVIISNTHCIVKGADDCLHCFWMAEAGNIRHAIFPWFHITLISFQRPNNDATCKLCIHGRLSWSVASSREDKYARHNNRIKVGGANWPLLPCMKLLVMQIAFLRPPSTRA